MKLAAIIIVWLSLCACEPSYWLSGPVGKAIRKEVRVAQKTKIHLRELTAFEWDALYLYAPYTSREVICQELGISKEFCHQEISDESMNDGKMYLVFQMAGNIVHKEMYSRFNGDFTPINFALPLTPERAVFEVIEDGVSSRGKPWFRLKLRTAPPIQTKQKTTKA